MQFFSEQTPSLPLAGGKVCTFNAGTTTPAATYTDISGTSQNTNPIVLDGSGFATIYLANQEYKFIVYDSSGNTACPNSGVQQWAQDNVNAFQPVVGTQTIIFAGVTVDPTGQAGMMDYRTDLGKFRGFNTSWDSFVTENVTATLTNKTLTAPTITGAIGGSPSIATPTFTNPNINGIVMVGQPATYISLGNDITTGTTLNTLTKMLGGSVVISAAGDAGGSIGITVAGAGKTGFATIQQGGAPTCIFDNATTAGDYVQISATVAGNCHDAGATYPSSGQIIGRVNSTGPASTIGITLFGPEIKPTPLTVAKVDQAQSANIASTPLFTPAAAGYYRISAYVVVTVAATVSSTLPTCNLLYTDGDTSVVEPAVPLTPTTGTTNTVGFSTIVPSFNTVTFYAKGGVAISFSTTGYASSGATAMTYALHLRLEGPL